MTFLVWISATFWFNSKISRKLQEYFPLPFLIYWWCEGLTKIKNWNRNPKIKKKIVRFALYKQYTFFVSCNESLWVLSYLVKLKLEPANLTAPRVKNVLTYQCPLCVFFLTCQHVLRAYVRKCNHAFHAPVPTCLECLRASLVNMPFMLMFSCVNMPYKLMR